MIVVASKNEAVGFLHILTDAELGQGVYDAVADNEHVALSLGVNSFAAVLYQQ